MFNNSLGKSNFARKILEEEEEDLGIKQGVEQQQWYVFIKREHVRIETFFG